MGKRTMIYLYHCKFCDEPHEVIKPWQRCEVDELCPIHKAEMERITVNKVRVNTPSFIEGFQPAFGKTFTNKRQQQEYIRRLEGTTGKEIIEVGNETPKLKREGPKYDIERATHELRKKWQKQ